jgi:hypothetical protein
MAGELRPIPEQDTPEYVDFLIEALVEEVLIYACFDTSTDAVDCHISASFLNHGVTRAGA